MNKKQLITVWVGAALIIILVCGRMCELCYRLPQWKVQFMDSKLLLPPHIYVIFLSGDLPFIVAALAVALTCTFAGKKQKVEQSREDIQVMTSKGLSNTVIMVSCLVLATSYFLPVTWEWAPVDAWLGYYSHSGGQFVKGFNIGLIEVFPFAVGLIILFALAFLRRPTIGVCGTVTFAATWVISLVLEVCRIVGDAHYRLRALWVTLAVLIVPLVVGIMLLALRKFRKRPRILVLTLAAMLAASSILQQSCSIAWYLLEDRLLLNIGCVTGTAAAATLIVGLLVRRQVLASCVPLEQPRVQAVSTSGTDNNSQEQEPK